jgi:hypothetical protein
MDYVRRFLSHFEGVKRQGNGWSAKCPAHDDKHASLSIAVSDDGKILTHCHAGCSTETIVRARGLTMADLFPPKDPPSSQRQQIFPSYQAAVAALSKKFGDPYHVWKYHDANGQLAFVVARWDPPDSRKEIRAISRSGEGWKVAAMPAPRPIYNLEGIRSATTVIVTEGEKAADAAISCGFAATTSAGGADSASKSDWSTLAGKHVVIIPDNDDAGRKYANTVASLCRKSAAATIKIVDLAQHCEGMAEHDDIHDVVVKPHLYGLPFSTPRQIGAWLTEIIAKTPILTAEQTELPQAVTEADTPGPRSPATAAIDIGKRWELWRCEDCAYASIRTATHTEHWPVRSQSFRGILSREYFLQHDKALSSEAMQAAINHLEAEARSRGKEYPTFVRVGELDGNLYLDLANDRWEAVEISPSGWRVVEHPPIRFRRSRGMKALPHPVDGHSLEDLKNMIAIPDEEWIMVATWMISTLCPRGPYPILAIFGEHGSGKSTAATLLRNTIDPNVAPLRSQPLDVRDLVIAACNSRCLAFDNISHIQPWFSDALCRLSTGGGFSTRELYTNDDETIKYVQCPVILTSIEEAATRSDLLDRCLIVSLPYIPDTNRRTEKQINAEFQQIWPGVLGALLRAASTALANINTIQLPSLPRLADFALWAAAAETGLGLKPGQFMLAYEAKRQSANQIALEASPLASTLLEFLDQAGNWAGTATELLSNLELHASETAKSAGSWPKGPRSLSVHLQRLIPNLRAIGWHVSLSRNASSRLWTFIKEQPEQDDGQEPPF